MASEIEKLLDEQIMTNLHLELLEDNNSKLDDIFLEQEITNDILGGMVKSIDSLKSDIKNSFKGLSHQFANSFKHAKDNASETVDHFRKMVDRDSEIVSVIAQNGAIDEANNRKVEEWQNSFKGKMFSLIEKIPKTESLLKKFDEIPEQGQLEVPEELRSDKHFESLQSDSARQLFQLIAIEKAVTGTFALQKKTIEAAGDTVTTSGTGGKDDKDEEKDSAGGIMSLMTGKLGKKFPGLKKLGGLATKGLKILGPIAAVGFALFEFADGLKNAGEIVGKSKENLTLMEKTGAGFAQAISGITFGLIDAKDAYSVLSDIGTSMKSAAQGLFNLMPESLQKGVTSFIDLMFNEEEGIFGFAIKTFRGVVDNLSEGKIGDALLQLLTGTTGLLIGPDGIIARGLGAAVDGFKELFDVTISLLPNDMQTKVLAWKDSFVESVTSLFDSVTDLLPKSVKDFFNVDKGSTSDKLLGFLGFDDRKKDKPKSTAIANAEKKKQADALSRAIKEQPNKGIASPADSNSIALSKKRLDESNRKIEVTNDQPIIVNTPPPEKKQVVRRLSADDASIAFMNSNMIG